MAKADARSKLAVSLGNSAGAKLIIMRLRGEFKPELLIATRILSLASSTALEPCQQS